MGVFTVGEVARLSGLSIRALRHYDEIGILGPTSVCACSRSCSIGS